MSTGFSPTLQHLLEMTKDTMGKRAFLDAAAMGAGGGGGGAPPADPAAAAGGGGAPPADPAAMGGGGGGGGGIDPTMIASIVQPMIQQAMMGAGGGGAGAGAGAKALTPKIDEKAVLLQILKILARIADALKIPIPASEMVVTGGDLNSLAQQQTAGTGGGTAPTGGDPAAGQSAIPPIEPMDAAAKMAQDYSDFGTAYPDQSEKLTDMAGEAAALAMLLER